MIDYLYRCGVSVSVSERCLAIATRSLLAIRWRWFGVAVGDAVGTVRGLLAASDVPAFVIAERSLLR